MASSPFTTPPASFRARFDPQLFRVLLLRRLWQPLSPVSRICRCGRPLDSSGHHHAACANSGVLGRRGFAVESAVARVRREAAGRVSCNVFVRDLDVGVPVAGDGRRLEVVTGGLPLFHGPQLALDATMVSALRWHGTPHRRAAEEDWAVLRAARRRKERTYPELTGRFGRARLVAGDGQRKRTTKGQSSWSSPTIEDERQTELAVEVEVDSRVCRRQSVRPVTVGTEGRNRSQLLHSQK